MQLSSVADDLHEDHNLAAKHTERVTEMVTLLRQQILKGRSTSGPKLENRRGVNIFQRLPVGPHGVVRHANKRTKFDVR